MTVDATRITPRGPVPLLARIGGQPRQMTATAAVETWAEVDLLNAGGAIPHILDRITCAT